MNLILLQKFALEILPADDADGRRFFLQFNPLRKSVSSAGEKFKLRFSQKML